MSHKNMQPHKAENIPFMSLSMFDTFIENIVRLHIRLYSSKPWLRIMKQDSWCPASPPGAQQMSSYTSLSHTIYIIKIMVSIYISDTFWSTCFHLLTHLFGYENDQCWELIAFVAAQKGNSVPKTVPLFYELSCKEVKFASNGNQWFKKWEGDGYNLIIMESTLQIRGTPLE